MARAPRRILIGAANGLEIQTIDGAVINLGDLRSKDGGATVYIPEAPWSKLEGILGSGDRILASASAPVEARLKCPGGGVLRIQDACSGWGLDGVAEAWSGEELARFCGEAEDLLQEYGLPWGLSASAVAAEAVKDEARAEGAGFKLRQLRPRWRTLAHEAVHVGPIACVYGGGRSPVTTLDLCAAYLQGLAQPLPVPGSWIPFGPWDRWAQVRRKEGLVRAIVDVPQPRWRGLGLLPVRLFGGRTIHPSGRIVGSWTIAQLREAEELGAEVVQLVEGATCKTAPVLAGLAERLWCLRESGGLGRLLARAVYTRIWGIMVSRGRWEGARAEDDALRPPAPRRVRESSSLVYAHLRPLADPLSPRAEPVYRPDWAAFISGWTARLMMRACDALSGQLVAVHVDSLSTMTGEDHARRWVASALRTGLWHEVQAPARGRWWGPGLAVHGDRLLQQGCPGTVSALELARWATRGLGGEQPGLTWTVKGGARASRWAEARSTAWRLPGELLHQLAWGGEDVEARLSLWSPIWTPKGWTQDPPEGMLRDERLGPRAPLGPPLVEPDPPAEDLEELEELEEAEGFIPSGFDDPGP